MKSSLKRKHDSDSSSAGEEFPSAGSSSSSDVESSRLSFAANRRPTTPRQTRHVSTVEDDVTPRPKRRKYTALAQNLSKMSLFEQVRAGTLPTVYPESIETPPLETGPDQPLWASPSVSDEVMAMDADGDVAITDAGYPSVVEEPDAAALPDIRMKGSSSYEPIKDHIIITDLEASEDEESEQDSANLPPTSYSVSPAALSRLQKIPMVREPAVPFPRNLALVKYSPSPWTVNNSHELDGIYRVRDASTESQTAQEQTHPDADAMDVE